MNTRLAFDTEILLNNNKNEKVILYLYIDGKKQTKRISTKILKMDENNQYRHAMTKALPYGCMKKQEHLPSLTELNRTLDKISHNGKIGHLFIADIKSNEHSMKYTPTPPTPLPIFEKTKKMGPHERSTLQLMSIMRRDGNKNKIISFPYSSKTYSTLKDKKFIPLYAEDLHVLINRVDWLVTHI